MADVGALAVELRRVVKPEVGLDQGLVIDLRRVVLGLDDLDVSGRAAAYLLVGRVVDGAALVADDGVDDPVELAKALLDLPEAAGAEGRLLGCGRACARSLVLGLPLASVISGGTVSFTRAG